MRIDPDVDATVDVAVGEATDESGEAIDTTVDPIAPTPNGWRATAARADGRRRRRQGAVVVGVALASAAAGVAVGSQIKSPADEAAARQAPPASRITVPVERQILSSSLVLSGEIQFNEPTPIRLAGSVGVEEGEAQVVTAVPTLGQLVQDGDVLLEVTGRPVFVMQGDLPMYRRLASGSEGPDVLQLETALERLGFQPGQVDNVFDAATAAAVTQMYSEAGYEAEGPSRAQRDELRLARQAVTDAEATLRSARENLDRDTVSLPESQLLQLRQAVASAEAAVPAAEQAAERARLAAGQEVRTATVGRDASLTIRDSARTIRNSVTLGAIDPGTGEPVTAERIAQLDTELAQAEESLAQAEQTLANSVNNQETSVGQAASAIKEARNSLDVARLQLTEATQPADTTDEQAAVSQAQQALDTSRADLTLLEAAVGVRLSPGELLFVPIAPTTVTELYVVPGSPASDQIGTLSTAETLISTRVSRGDSGLITVGAPVTIDLRDISLETTGTVVSMGQPREDPNADGNGGGGDGGGTSRLEVLIAPDDPSILSDYVFYGVRATIDVASTDDEVLVVPVAALSVGPDGSSRVEVEIEPVTDTSSGSTKVVEVEVGLTAQGLVEIRSPDIDVGDDVVVGVETGERRDLGSADGSDDS